MALNHAPKPWPTGIQSPEKFFTASPFFVAAESREIFDGQPVFFMAVTRRFSGCSSEVFMALNHAPKPWPTGIQSPEKMFTASPLFVAS